MNFNIKPLDWIDTNSLAKRKLVAFDVFGNEFARLDYDPDEDNETRIAEFKRDAQADYEQRILSALSAPAQRVEEGVHPDDQAVDRFAAAMKAKLAKKRDEGRGGWWDDAYCNNDELSAMLRNHVDKGDPLDVGNLAMMLHQRDERIASPDPAPHAGVDAEDTRLLNALRDESWDLRCFDIPTGGGDADIGWRVIGHWMAAPRERTIAEVFHDEPRDAIRAALGDRT